MITPEKLREIQKKALAAVADMPDGELKTKAFEVFLQHLLNFETIPEDKRLVPKQKPILKGKGTPMMRNKKELDLSEIVNLVKSCDEAEQIEAQILDRVSQVDRTLLPLYIVHKYLDNKNPLTTGQISKVTMDLGIPVATANASRTLAGTASKYVMGDKVRKRGQPVRYKLSRRGAQYMKKVIEGSEVDK